MSTPLRAFLMLTDGLGGWDVQVHRDLESLVKAWLERPASVFAAVVHIGFERSRSSSFDEIDLLNRRFLNRRFESKCDRTSTAFRAAGWAADQVPAR